MDESSARNDPGLLENTLDNIVVIVSGDGTICSLIGESILPSGQSAAELPGSPIESLWSDEMSVAIRNNIKRALRSRQSHSARLENVSCGTQYEFIFVAQGRDRVLIIARDISEQKNAISEMQHLAYTDKVTGLPNREFLFDQLSKITVNLRLIDGRAAVICIELNDLDLAVSASRKKQQDAILKELATRLIRELRGANQTEYKDQKRYSIVARLDFRQFAVVLPNIDVGADAASVATRLSGALQQPIEIGGRQVSITVSTGIALFPQDGTDANALIDNAGAAVEDAKNSQTQRQKFNSGTVKVRALKRQDLALELRSALDRNEFDLNFQPIVGAERREVTAVEAFLRRPNGVLGVRSIQDVITLAEYTGLIVPLGEWVLRRACEQLHAWHNSGHPTLRLSINFSLLEFSQPDLVQRLDEILSDSSIEPHYVDLEITEHILLRDAMREFETCRELKEFGIGVVLDDFGTGACSLAHLSHGPVDAIKIDGSFVTHLQSSSNDRDACAAATALAHALNFKVVAECVETGEQAALLTQLGCDFLQGFLFFKPSSASDVSDYLEDSCGRESFT